jgi:WD40 repeat protein
LLGHTDEIRALVFSPNETTIASAGDDGAIRLWTMPLPPLAA